MSTEAPEKEINPQAKDDITPDFLKDDAYKQRQETPAGDPSDPRGEKSLTDDQLSNKEAGVGDSSKDKADSAEKDSLFTGEEKPGRASRFRKRLTMNARKKMAIGGAIGVLGFGGVGIFSIVQGPLQAIHLAQILGNSFSDNENTVAKRTQGLYRYFRSGNIGETRLGSLGSKMNTKILADLEKAGIKITTNSVNQPRIVEIDPKINPELKPLSPEERIARLSQDFGVDPDKISVSGNGTLRVDTEGSKIGAKRRIILKSLGLTYKSKVFVAGAGRIVTKYFDTPSLFHPLKRLASKIDAATAETIRRKLAERKPNSTITDQEIRKQFQIDTYNKFFQPNEVTLSKISKIKKSIGSPARIATTSAGGVLTFTAGICLANDIVGDLPEINRAVGAAPAMLGAYSAMAHGAQGQSGNDLYLEQMGVFVSTFKDKEGKTIWQSRELNELQGEHTGTPIDPEIKQSFSPDRSTRSLEEALDEVNAGALCSPIGQVVQAGVGLVLIATTGGAANAVLKIGAGVAGGVIIAQVISYLQKHLADEPLYEKVFAGGPLGGSLLAYGAEEGSGVVARSMGGVAFSATASQQIRSAAKAENMNEFKTRGIASKLFDAYDHRSITASIVRMQPEKLGENLITTIGSSLSLGNWTDKISLPFVDQVSAATETSYEWSVPRYGFSSDILDAEKYQDPYNNADLVAEILRRDLSQYEARALSCFGIKLQNGTSGWEAIPEKDVNPASKDYHDANCGDESNEDWIRIRLFIMDTRSMTAFACMEGDDTDVEIQKACADLGIGQVTATATTTPPVPASANADLLNTITVSEGAQFVTLPSRYSCPGRTTRIDARIAASLAYILDTYEMCADDGLANGHVSHGAGLGVDIRPKDQSKQMSKDEWNRTAGRFLSDINWWGDASDKPKSSKGCAKYVPGGYGGCVGGVTGPKGAIPNWVRWIGYNGDVNHGDPWHVYGGSYAHIHVGWTTPNRDGIAASIIRPPRQSVSTFPAPIPDDLKDILPAVLISGGSPQ